LDCKEHSIVENNICKCDNNYIGIGYIKCYKGDYSECQYINSIFGQDESYNYCYDDEVTCFDDHITKL